jgi:hypothetical protein
MYLAIRLTCGTRGSANYIFMRWSSAHKGSCLAALRDSVNVHNGSGLCENYFLEIVTKY